MCGPFDMLYLAIPVTQPTQARSATAERFLTQ
jgi:hypothetical protein